MIKFKNPQNILIFEWFFEQFGPRINQLYNGEAVSEISGINSKHPISQAILSPSDPFATNVKLTPLAVALNEPVCISLNLTEEEQYAMIAHEIGHILDSTPREDNQPLRERNADQFALRLGLDENLLSGLEKLVKSGAYEGEAEQLKHRIEYLKLKIL